MLYFHFLNECRGHSRATHHLLGPYITPDYLVLLHDRLLHSPNAVAVRLIGMWDMACNEAQSINEVRRLAPWDPLTRKSVSKWLEKEGAKTAELTCTHQVHVSATPLKIGHPMNFWVPDLQVSCIDLTSKQGTLLTAIATLGLILGLHPGNEKRRYEVTPSVIGWAQT